MGPRVRRCVVAAAMSAAAGAGAGAQARPQGKDSSAAGAVVAPRYRFRLLGAFDDATGEPIEGVEVTDVLSGVGSLTSKTGTLSLFFLPDSGSLVRVRKVGYEMQTLPIAISPRDTAPITVLLKKAVELPAVVVKDSAPAYHFGSLRDAEARMRARAGGYFLDEAEMRKWDNSTLANALTSKMPGILPTTGPHGERYFVSSRTPCRNAFTACTRPNCFVSVYIDGAPSTVLTDFSRASTMDYAIAEFYPGGSSEPVAFSSACGALLLWTRQR